MLGRGGRFGRGRESTSPSPGGADAGGGGRGRGGLGGSGGPVGLLVKGIASGIGLASESIHHHKEKKKAEKAEKAAREEQPGPSSAASRDHAPAPAEAYGSSFSPAELPSPAEYPSPAELPDSPKSADSDDAVENIWELDAIETSLHDTPPPSYEEIGPRTVERFVNEHPQPPAFSPSRLALPVVIPQRRPKDRVRGFVRAYAPLLQDVGIDQSTFFDFLDTLNKAVEPSPWIQAINLAGFAGQAVPEPFTILISIAVKKVADASANVHSRTKTNAFLDTINKDFFAPRGLICLVVTWKPQVAGQLMTTVDFENNIVAGAANNDHQGFGRVQHSLQSSSGSSSFEWPETAPLIFPELDKLAATEDSNAKKANALKRGGNFVGEYLDKRAQAQWAGQNPDSNLANTVPKPEFHSRYADPNHPASSGDPLALLTGGHVTRNTLVDGRTSLVGRGSRLDERREARGQSSRLADRRAARGRDDRITAGGVRGMLPLSGGIRKLLHQDVLYLMIVNHPSQEEIANASAVAESMGLA